MHGGDLSLGAHCLFRPWSGREGLRGPLQAELQEAGLPSSGQWSSVIQSQAIEALPAPRPPRPVGVNGQRELGALVSSPGAPVCAPWSVLSYVTPVTWSACLPISSLVGQKGSK